MRHGLFALNRKKLLVVMIAAAAVPFVVYTGNQAFLVLTVILQELLYQAIYLLPCWLLGNAILSRWRCENPSLAAASAIALGLGILSLLILALGLAGILNAVTGWGTLLAMSVIGIGFQARRVGAARFTWEPVANWLAAGSEGGWIWLMPGMLFAIALTGATLIPGWLWRPDDPHPYDSLLYHLQVPREWFEAGKIVALKHNVFSFFPFNVEMHYLLADHLRGGPWQAVQQAQFFSISTTLVAALALWGFVREHTNGRAAALAVAAFLSTPWVLMLACVSYVESGMVMWAVLGVAWFLRGIQRGQGRDFAIGGLFAGLACGAKLTAIPMLLVGLPVAATLVLAIFAFRNIHFGKFIMGCFIFGLVGLAALSPWLIRNAIWCGNPLFPLAARQLGQAHFSDTQVQRFERAHRPAAEHAAWNARLGRLTGQIAVSWRYNYILFPLAIVGLVLNRRDPLAWTMAILAVLMLIIWITTTHLMGRFYVLALIPAIYLIAIQPPRMVIASAALLALAALNSYIGPVSFEGLSRTSNLHELFSPNARFGRKGLYGLQDYAVMQRPNVRERIDAASDVVLVGDTQAFSHPVPMTKLHYCTVFDLNLEGDRDIFDAYYGPPPAKCPHDVLLLIDEAEARRLSRTYWKVPPVPIPSEGRFQQYIVLNP